MSGLTGFDVSGVDLSYIFQPRTSGTNQETKYIAKNGLDLSNIFQPLGTNPLAPLTGFNYKDTNNPSNYLDLN